MSGPSAEIQRRQAGRIAKLIETFRTHSSSNVRSQQRSKMAEKASPFLNQGKPDEFGTRHFAELRTVARLDVQQPIRSLEKPIPLSILQTLPGPTKRTASPVA